MKKKRNSEQNPWKLCWSCGRILDEQRHPKVEMIDGRLRTLHATCLNRLKKAMKELADAGID